MKGSKIQVLIHEKKDDRKVDTEKYTNLYVRNLPENFTQDQLKELFKEFGVIDSVRIGDKPGKGYVSFKEHKSAKTASE